MWVFDLLASLIRIVPMVLRGHGQVRQSKGGSFVLKQEQAKGAVQPAGEECLVSRPTPEHVIRAGVNEGGTVCTCMRWRDGNPLTNHTAAL